MQRWKLQKKDYSELCEQRAETNERRWQEWLKEYNAKSKVFEEQVRNRLEVQLNNMQIVFNHQRKIEEEYQHRLLETQLKFEGATKSYHERKELWDKEQKAKVERYHVHVAEITQRNQELLEKGRAEWEKAVQEANHQAYQDFEAKIKDWKNRADDIQAKNDEWMENERQRHRHRVDKIRQQNEKALSAAREDYEEEVASVEYFNASVQPVIEKADRANVLIADIERFLEEVFQHTSDFQGIVEMPVIITGLKKVFPGQSSQMLVQAFEEHFTQEELRTRSFYPYYHHHFIRDYY